MTTYADIAAALDRLAIAAHRQRAAAAATLPDLNATDLLALTIIHRTGPIQAGPLARQMHLTDAGVNGVIRRVFGAGMVDRTTSPRYRRDVRLTVTMRGALLMTTGAAAWENQLLERLAALPSPGDVVNLFAAVAEAAEQRATTLASEAAEKRRRLHQTLRPLRWS